MRAYRQAGTVILVSARSPEATFGQEIESHGLAIRWARTLKQASVLLDSRSERTIVVTELAVADGNWRDLVDRIRRSGTPIPVVLVTSCTTAELWWDALECGVDEILTGPLHASRLCTFFEAHFGV